LQHDAGRRYRERSFSRLPSPDKREQAIDPPDRFKTADYQGIPDYTDGGYVIKHPGSEKGAGRYEMFVNDGKGIAGLQLCRRAQPGWHRRLRDGEKGPMPPAGVIRIR
jgi:hypothetical protein